MPLALRTAPAAACLWLTAWSPLLAEPAPAPAPSVEAQYAQVYAERDSGPLKADVYLPQGPGPFPGVLVVHGGAWRMGNRAQLSSIAQRLARRGYVAAAISYRLAPEHPFPAQLEDCQAAFGWMVRQAAQWKLDPTRIGGFGYSAGGHLVALLGALPATASDAEAPQADALRLKAVVGGGAPCDFREFPLDSRGLAFWLGGTRRDVGDLYRAASPAAHVSPDDPPMFFFHGEADQLVPLASPQQMCAALQAVGVPAELYVAPALGHMGPPLDPQSLQRAFQFLDRQLGRELAP